MANRASPENGVPPLQLLELPDDVRRELTELLRRKGLDYSAPCTATRHHTCRLIAQLPAWNNLLLDIGYQLREMRGALGQLSLSLLPCIISCLALRTPLLHWLLTTHRCIGAVDYDFISNGRYKMPDLDKELICNSLRLNTSIRVLRFKIWDSPSDPLVKAIPHLKHLEELVCSGDHYSPLLILSVSILLRSTSSLSCLEVPEITLCASQANILVTALRRNTSLKTLSVGSSIIDSPSQATRDEFADFLKSCKLTALTISGNIRVSRACLKLVLDALLHSQTLSEVKLKRLEIDEASTRLIQKVAEGNRVLRKFELTGNDKLKSQGTILNSSANFWGENETLEELTLPFGLMDPEHWKMFLHSCSAKRNAMKVTIEGDVACNDFLNVSNDLLQNCESANISFKLWPRWEPFVKMLDENVLSGSRISALSLDIAFCSLSERMSSVLGRFIRETTALKELSLVVYCGDQQRWPPRAQHFFHFILKSLESNSSIGKLAVKAEDLPREEAECLADTVKRSSNIRRGDFWIRPKLDYFIFALSRDITDNYTLTDIRLQGDTYERHEYCFRIIDTARRNFGLVSEVSKFLSGRHCNRHSTPHALKTVQRHSALIAELAEEMCVSDADAAEMVRDGIRRLEDNLHLFMRVIGIVGERIECYPRRDGRAQLDSLNDDCFRVIRQYLKFEDVRHSSSCICNLRGHLDQNLFI